LSAYLYTRTFATSHTYRIQYRISTFETIDAFVIRTPAMTSLLPVRCFVNVCSGRYFDVRKTVGEVYWSKIVLNLSTHNIYFVVVFDSLPFTVSFRSFARRNRSIFWPVIEQSREQNVSDFLIFTIIKHKYYPCNK